MVINQRYCPLDGKGRSMVRISFAVAVVAVLAATVGCTMCCHPYDECGPVYEGRFATGCSKNVRQGSVFSGTSDTSSETSPAHVNPQPTPATDAVEEDGDAQQTTSKKKSASELTALASGTSKKATKTSTKKSQPVTPQRWTTKTTTDESLR
jgi:hypothetical protein